MRVIGDNEPKVLQIEPFGFDNKIEIRVRENIHENIIEYEGTSKVEYIYDEYTFILDDSEELRESLNNNIDKWLVTGRNLEINVNATLYLNAKSNAIDEYTTELIKGGLL